MADNKIRFGVSNARYALVEDDGTFGPWNRIPGAVQIQLEPQESQNDFYADNIVYFTQQGAASDQVTIELADLPDQAKIDLLGYKRINGSLALPVDYRPKEFVLGFQVVGDETTLRVNVFGGKLMRSSETHSTKNDSTEPETMSFEGRFNGRTFVVEGEEEAYLYYTGKTGEDNFDGWWDEVKTPGDTAVSADATLSALSVGSLTLSPAFSADVTTYTVTTSNDTNAVTATANDDGATVSITVNGSAHTSGQSATWQEGQNVVSVIVTNDTATKAYTIIVTKSE